MQYYTGPSYSIKTAVVEFRRHCGVEIVNWGRKTHHSFTHMDACYTLLWIPWIHRICMVKANSRAQNWRSCGPLSEAILWTWRYDWISICMLKQEKSPSGDWGTDLSHSGSSLWAGMGVCVAQSAKNAGRHSKSNKVQLCQSPVALETKINFTPPCEW